MDDLRLPYISQMVTTMSKQWGPRSGEGTVGRQPWPRTCSLGSSWLRTISNLWRGKTLNTQAGRLAVATMTVSPGLLATSSSEVALPEAELPPITLKHLVGSTPGSL